MGTGVGAGRKVKPEAVLLIETRPGKQGSEMNVRGKHAPEPDTYKQLTVAHQHVQWGRPRSGSVIRDP